MRDVNYGWLIRYAHANGASFFFICVYIHIGRGLYYGSYTRPRIGLWFVGVIIYFLMMGIAFLGYVLPWGQMSFWGATVITNMFSAIPYLGGDIVSLLWGGFAVENPTLNRFFSLHFLLPFVLAALVVVHIIFLHVHASTNPLGISSNMDKLPLHPYYSYKDYFGFAIFGIVFSLIVFFYPNLLGPMALVFMTFISITKDGRTRSSRPPFFFRTLYARKSPARFIGVLNNSGVSPVSQPPVVILQLAGNQFIILYPRGSNTLIF